MARAFARNWAGHDVAAGRGTVKPKPDNKKGVLTDALREICRCPGLACDGFADLEALALAARNAGQLREAVRFRYLHALHLLENVGLITRTKDKTNMDYLRELGRTSYYQPFAAITLQYEYVWYGKMSLSEAQYGRVNEAFEDFKNSLTK